MAQPEVGSQIAGYRIESLIGRGGMGVVYRATQLDLGRTVALKVIAPEALDDAAARARFVSEARHAAAIEHPHVVPIHGAGEHDGVAYFAMRFIDGDDLRGRVRARRPARVPAPRRITRDLGRGARRDPRRRARAPRRQAGQRPAQRRATTST